MTDYTNIAARAVLVRFAATTWAARKLDKKATKTANDTHNATANAGRYNKHLLADAEAHTNVVNAIGNARTTFYKHTLPWGDDNWRLLPTANFIPFTEAIRKAQDEIAQALHTFIVVYPALRVVAQKELGDLYNEKEYPEPADVRSRFTWGIDYSPVPTEGDLRLELPADHLAQIEQAVTSRVEAAAKVAANDAWRQLREAVERIQKAVRAGGEQSRAGTVRESLIDHLNEVVERLGRLNVAQDEGLVDALQRAQRELGGIAVEDLRKDETLRSDTERRANEILAAMQGLYGQVAVEPAA